MDNYKRNFSLFFFVALLFFFSVSQNFVHAEIIKVINVDCLDEIFPVFALLGRKVMNEDNGIIDWEIKNISKNEQTVKLTSEFINYSFPCINTLTLKPGETKKISQATAALKTLGRF